MMNIDSLFQQAITAQQQQQPQRAEQLYRQLLTQQPEHAAALTNLGLVLRQKGDLDGALQCYLSASTTSAVPAEIFFNLGNLYLTMGQPQAALQSYQQLLQQLPQHKQGLMQLARCQVQLGNLASAVTTYQQLLQLHSDYVDAWLELGNIQRQLLQTEEAQVSYQQLLQIDSSNWKGHYALGRLLQELQQPEPAQLHLQQAVTLSPQPDQLLTTLGNSHLGEGRNQQALQAFQQALQHNPQAQMARIGLGQTLMRLGRPQLAYRQFEEVSKCDDVVVLNRLAEISMSFNLWSEALQILRKVLQCTDNHIDARYNLANASTTAYQLTDALTLINECIAVRPQAAGYYHLLGNIQVKRGAVEAGLQALVTEQQLQGHNSGLGLNFARLYSDRVDIETHSQQHFAAGRQLVQQLTNRLIMQPRHRDPERPLRIGYVSGDIFYQHPVDIFLQPLFAQHDRDNFAITLYYNGSGYDDRTRLARNRVEQWRETANWADERLFAQIQQDQIDILVDLSGHTGRNRLTLFAQRVAPLQLTMVGYPFTTGLPTMDYYLADAVTIPQQEEQLYSEKILRLPRFVFCYPMDLHPPNPPRPERTQVVFGSFNNIPKLTPRTIGLWARILVALPESRLLLKAPSFQDSGVCDAYRSQFAELGVAAERITFRGPTALNQMMQEYNDIDIALDPLPFNGGTTSMQALLAGTPLISRCGSGFFQRMGAGMLQQLGHPNWIAHSDEEYIAKAVALAGDSNTLRQIQQQLPQQLAASGLTDTLAYTRDVEQCYRTIWREWCEQ